MMEEALCKMEFNAVYLEGEGFVYRLHDSDTMYTFKRPEDVPENMHLMCSMSFVKLRRQMRRALKLGKLNEQYADEVTWCDRGLRIVVVSGTIGMVTKLGSWRVDTGEYVYE